MSDEELLDDLLLDWQDHLGRGRDVPAADLCPGRPDLAAELAGRIARLRPLRALVDAAADPTPGPNGASGDTGPHHPSLDTGPFPGGAAPADLPAVPGFEVLGVLGRGGMGVVYKARQTSLNRVVALKMVLAGGHAGAEDLARFLAEAEAVAGLSHPNVVQVHEYGAHDGRPFLVLEYLPGGSLADRLRGDPRPPRDAADLVRTLALAVQAAHESGIVHRDLKPANVLLAADGAPKVTDFGLAKRAGSDLTATGAVMGTPSYMAPEQASGKTKEVGPPADVWALGAILYELLTGRPPFKGASAWDTVQMVVSADPVPPARLNAKVPKDLETVCLKCLQKDPGKRYPTARALVDELGRFLEGRPILARPVGAGARAWRWARRRPAVAALLAGLAACVLAGLIGTTALYLRAERRRQEAEDRRRDAVLAAAAATRAEGVAKENEGRARTAEHTADAARRQSDNRLLGQLNDRAGHRVADGDYFGAALSYAQALRLVEDDPERAPIQRERLAGVLAQAPRLCWMRPHDRRVTAVDWSADGTRVLVASADGTARVLSVPDGKPLAVLRHRTAVLAAALSADGTRALTGSLDGTVRYWDVAAGREVIPTFTHQAMANGRTYGTPVRWVGLRANGELVSAAIHPASRGGEVVRRAADGWPVGDPYVVTSSRTYKQFEMHVAASAAADRLLLSLRAPRGAYSTSGTTGPNGEPLLLTREGWSKELWELDLTADRTRGRNRTPPDRECQGYYAPDGRLYLHDLEPAGGSAVYTLAPAADDGAAGPGFRTAGEPAAVSFSPDGARVAVGGYRQVQVWKRAAPDEPPATLDLDGTVTELAFGPGGRLVAVAGSHQTVRVWRSAGGARYAPATPVLRHGRAVRTMRFSPTGRYLLTATEDGVARLWDLEAAAEPGLIARPPIGFGPDTRPELFTPDRRRFLMPLYGGSAASSLLRVLDLSAGKELGQAIRIEPFGLPFGAISPDGRRVAGPVRVTSVGVWEADTGKPVGPPLGHPVPVLCVAFSPDGEYLVSAASNRGLLWHGPDLKPVFQQYTHPGGVIDRVAFSADNRWVATACGPGDTACVFPGPAARPWEEAGRPTAQVGGQTYVDVRGQALTAAGATLPVFSPDGTVLATAGKDAVVRLWAVGAPAGPPRRAIGHTASVTRVAFDPHGRRLLTATSDGVARVWDVGTGQPVSPPMAHAQTVLYAGFNPDGTRVVTACKDGTVRVWETATGGPITPPVGAGGPAWYAAFEPGGTVFAAAQSGFRRWPVPTTAEPAGRLLLRAELLAGLRIDERGFEVPLEPAALEDRWKQLDPAAGAPPALTPGSN